MIGPRAQSPTHVRPPPPAEGILAPHVQAAELDKNYKMPMKLTPYTGVKDPKDHLLGFTPAMNISNMGDPQRCKLFPITLEGPALDWYSKLPVGLVHCFRDLEDMFMKQFATSKVYKQPMMVLFDIRQNKGESLRTI